jgi:hypothetical protein
LVGVGVERILRGARHSKSRYVHELNLDSQVLNESPLIPSIVSQFEHENPVNASLRGDASGDMGRD